MSGTMICTNCFCDTGVEPDFGDMARHMGGGQAIADLCAHWMCSDCLDQAEYEAGFADEDALRTKAQENSNGRP